MALAQLDWIGGGGDSTTKVAQGEFQTSSSVATVISDIGFRPDYLYIESDVDKVGNYHSNYSYTSEVSSLKAWYDFTKAGVLSDKQIQTLSTADNVRGTLLSVDSNGFTYSKVQGNANYPSAPKCRYVAIKYTET